MAAGDPTGDDLCVGTTDGNTLPETPTWTNREISLGAGVALVSGTQYAIVVRSATSEVEWVTVAGDNYANGSSYLSDDAGDSWSIDTGYDNWFQTYAGLALRDQYGPGDYSVYNTVDGSDWVAQTFTATSSYTITKVKLRLSRWPASTPGTITVSIKAVEGVPGPQKVTTPSPVDTYSKMTLDWQQFTWVADGDAPEEEVYNIYWGTTSGDLSLIALEVGDAAVAAVYLSAVVGAGIYGRTYYWRVDTYWPSTEETATGDEWSFTTISFDHPAVSYILLGGGSGSGPYDTPPGVEGTDFRYTGENNMITVKRLVAVANNKFWYEDV